MMDEPGIDPAAHAQALAGLRRINGVSHTARRMAEPIAEMARARGWPAFRCSTSPAAGVRCRSAWLGNCDGRGSRCI